MAPVIIMCARGTAHLIFCVWAIRSLRAHGYETIEVVVSNQDEKAYLHAHLGDVQCEVLDVALDGYRMWAHKPFTLARYQIKDRDSDVVICDTDILWREDPATLFRRFENKPWVHKITSLNPAEIDQYPCADTIPARRIGLRTMVAYKSHVGLDRYPNFQVNGGLFMLPREVYSEVIKRWVEAIRAVPPDEMIMTEAILSLIYAGMGLRPVSDRADIKHLGIAHEKATRPVTEFEIAETPEGAHTGYQTAKHYFGDQRSEFYRDVVALGLDQDNLLPVARSAVRRSWLRSLPSKVARRVKSTLGVG